MNWLTWRQHRSELFIAVLLLGLAVLGLLITQRILADLSSQNGAVVVDSALDNFRLPVFIPISLLPMLLGMFVGAPLVARELEALCPPSIDFPNSPVEEIERQNSAFACYQEHGLTSRITYQPVERFWLFQGIESGIFLALSAALFWFSQWRLKHLF